MHQMFFPHLCSRALQTKKSIAPTSVATASRPLTAPTKSSAAHAKCGGGLEGRASALPPARSGVLQKKVRQVLGGRELPFVTGGPAAKTFHLPSAVQTLVRSAPVATSAHDESTHTSPARARPSDSGVSHSPTMVWPHDESGTSHAQQTGAFVASLRRDERSSSVERAVPRRRPASASAATTTSLLSSSSSSAPVAKAAQAPAPAAPLDLETLRSLHSVVSALEAEVAELERQYNHALHSANDSLMASQVLRF